MRGVLAFAFVLSGCSLLVVKPVPSDWTAKSRRAPSCDDGAKLANAVDLFFAVDGLSLAAYGGVLAADDHVGAGISLIVLGLVTTGFFSYTADAGDDRAADCRAALMDYHLEISRPLDHKPSGPTNSGTTPSRSDRPVEP